MNDSLKYIVATFIVGVLLLNLSIGSASAQSSKTYKETRELLSSLKVDGSENSSLAILFRQGDKRINDLVNLLNDSDNLISKNAQIIIRYLNNSAGMDAVIYNYKKLNQVNVVGQIPVPLRDWDYEFIDLNFIDKPENFGQTSTEYIYALALDNSYRSKKILFRLLKTAKLAKTDPVIIKAVTSKEFGNSFEVTEKELLEVTVLKNSAFLSKSAKKIGSAKTISIAESQNKVLLEIYINYGVLAEEIYHVVIEKKGKYWSFSSISQIASS